MLKLIDLKAQGLTLSQPEAQEIHSQISGISQGHIGDGIVYEGTGETAKVKADPLKDYYAELQSKNTTLLAENNQLRVELENAISRQIKTVSSDEQQNGEPEKQDVIVEIPKVKEGKKPAVKSAKVAKEKTAKAK